MDVQSNMMLLYAHFTGFHRGHDWLWSLTVLGFELSPSSSVI
jgi:hypothetical protein